MKLDGHIHIRDGEIDSKGFLRRLEESGFGGGLILSIHPASASFPEIGKCTPSSERLDNLIEWTSISENLFPFFWIDPLENDAIEQVDLAVEKGVMGFKVICNNYYPSDERAMDVFRAIADKQKPLLFHSGILWDGRPTSKYNRPVEFETLLDIAKLKFSLAHVAWPWFDELIAVYGKFQNAYSRNPESSCEMFIDLSPGTPVIYRKEVLTILLTVGYDIENNLVFGSDSFTNDYNIQWSQQWINCDDSIYDEIGVSQKIKNKIYKDNLRRFVGISKKKVKRTILFQGQS